MDKRLLTIGVIMFTEIIGFSLILPFMPYMAEEFGASPAIVGLIIGVFSLCQFISAPIIGKLSDHYGRKPLLIISQLSTLIGFLILAFANSLWMIILSRVIDGLFGSNMTLSKAYLTDLSTGKKRRKQMSYLSAIYGLGMFIGPAIGGFFATINYSIPSLIASGITLLSIILTIIFLKETITQNKKVKITIQDFFPMKEFIKGLRVKELKEVFINLALFSSGFTIITSSLALFVKHQLGMGPATVGLLLMTIGFFRIFFQMTIMPKLIDKKEIKTIINIGLIIALISFTLLFFVNNIILLFIMGILLSTSGGLVRPMISAQVSEASKDNERGKMMGVVDSIWSIAQMTGPLIGGLVIQNYKPGYIGLISALMVSLALIYQLMIKMKRSAECRI